MRGKFITLEGGDGVGKSTQMKFIKQYIEQKGYSVLVTREPGGTAIGEKIRDILLDLKNSEMCVQTEALLYSAARAQHVNEKIIPALEEGKIVICDRFSDSSIAYQGFGRKIGYEDVASINEFAVCGLKPDLTLYFDLLPEKGIYRKKNVGDSLDRIESELSDFRRRVYIGYKEILKREPERIVKIDAEKSIELVKNDVILALNNIGL